MNFIFDVETAGLPLSNKDYKNLEAYEPAKLTSICWILTKGDSIVEQSYFIIESESQLSEIFEMLKISLEYVHNIISYNIEFDINVLKNTLFKHNHQDIIDVIDTKHQICCMKKAKEFLRMDKYPKLSHTYKTIFNSSDIEEDTLSNAINCFKCYNHMFPLSKDVFFIKNKKVELTPEQSEIVFAPLNLNMAVLASAGSGKCHALNTPILMYDGSIKLVQDVNVGDKLMGDDSIPRTVLSLGSGFDDMYEIKPIEEGCESFIVNSDHILCTLVDNVHVELSVKQYLKLDDYTKQKLRIYKKHVSFEYKQLLIDPYLLGVWLGNNDFARLVIYNPILVNHVKNILKSYNLSLYEYDNSYEIFCHEEYNIFAESLVQYGILKKSHIPLILKANSYITGLQLLAGIIDINAIYIDNSYLLCVNDNLIDDIIFICRSLGLIAFKNIYHEIIIKGPLHIIPTITQRPFTNFKDLSFKFEVIPREKDKYYGFTLNNNHRYLMGDFTVSHNTTTITARIKHLVDSGINEDAILLTTFTRDASNDMKQKLTDIFGYIPETRVGTIDTISKVSTFYNKDASKRELKDVSEHAKDYLDHIRKNPHIIKKYKYIFIDEFQDINSLQFDIIKEFHKKGAYIFAVGDDHQNIYTFRGSNIDYILNFKQLFPDNSDCFKLTYNFRSTREIINFANASISNNMNQIPKKMVPGILQNNPMPKPHVQYFSNFKFQNVFIINEVMKLIQNNVLLDEIAILSPLNNSLFLIEELLTQNKIKNVFLDSKSDVRTNKKTNHVCLCTIHKSKGLEWEYVFLTNMSDELIPKIKSPKQIEESRRLFYVAVTRAKKQLYITYSASSLSPYITRYVSEIPSQFYDFVNFNPEYKGVSDVDIMTLELSVTKLLDNLNGEDYIELKNQNILPTINIKDINKIQLYEPFTYLPIIEQEELYSDFGIFIDVLISSEIAKKAKIKYQDKYTLQVLASVIVDKDTYAIYKHYKTNFKNNINDVTTLDLPKVISIMSKSKRIASEHINKVYDLVSKIHFNSVKYSIPKSSVPVFTERFLPDDFASSMESHLFKVTNYKSYEDIVDSIWEISKCHAIITSYRRRLLFMDTKPSKDFIAYKELFKKCTEKLINMLDLSKNVSIHEDLVNSETNVYGELDLRVGDVIIDYKNTINDDITPSQLLQLLCYKSLYDLQHDNKISTIAIFNPLRGYYCPFEVSSWDKQEELLNYLVEKRDKLLSATKH